MDFQLDYQNRNPLFITLAGLPGTGKTTLAKSLAKKLSLVYLRLDCIEVPFYKYNAIAGSKGEGYDAIINLARENLNLGLGVIVDTVNPLHLTRKLFRDLAKESNANLLQFELKTNDLLLHKKRIEQRKSDIVGHNLPTWDNVRTIEYEKWDESVDGLATVIFTDNGEKAFGECLDTIRNHLDYHKVLRINRKPGMGKGAENMKHIGTQRIETGRLILRKYEKSDAAAMYQNWASDAEVTKYLTWPAHSSREISQNIINEWVRQYSDENYYHWAIVLKEHGDEPIGDIAVVGIRENTSKAHIGYCIGRKWWGKGITAEALRAVMDFLFDIVDVNRIEARHDPQNPNSGKVMMKCGMKYEGTLRESDWNNQGICDACYYALLKSER